MARCRTHDLEIRARMLTTVSVSVAVYPSLDLSDNEEETMSRVVEKRDESWNPGGVYALSSRYFLCR